MCSFSFLQFGVVLLPSLLLLQVVALECLDIVSRCSDHISVDIIQAFDFELINFIFVSNCIATTLNKPITPVHILVYSQTTLDEWQFTTRGCVTHCIANQEIIIVTSVISAITVTIISTVIIVISNIVMR